MTKKIILITSLILIFSFFLFGCEVSVGGDTDSNGCRGPDGYIYNKTINACLRHWEIKDKGEREAARIVVLKNGYAYGQTILDVKSGNCAGCYIVTIQIGDDVQDYILKGNVINPDAKFEIGYLPYECDLEGGYIIRTIDGDNCGDDKELGPIVYQPGDPKICCSE